MSNKLDSFIDKGNKFPGLGLLQNPKCTKRNKSFFKKQNTPSDRDTDISITKNKTDEFKQIVIHKLGDLEFPISTQDRCDPLKVILEAAFYQYACRTNNIDVEIYRDTKSPE
jgi:hypothetical protein